MITDRSINQARHDLEKMCMNWDKESEGYKTCMAGAIYLKEFMQFLAYIQDTDAARMYGDFIISNELSDSDY